MELALGTEPTNRYLSFEVARAARKLVEEVMLVKPGENVLVTVDTTGDSRVAQARRTRGQCGRNRSTRTWYGRFVLRAG